MAEFLRAIHHVFPSGERDNAALVVANPTWNAEKIFAKTGIRSRHVAALGQTAGDLGFLAASELLSREGIEPTSIDVLLFISESPDYLLPPTACILHNRLGLDTHCAAFDINLGCSGFTYGLWLAGGLIQSGRAKSVLLVCADTYSRYCDPHDLATVSLFGDGAAAALITATPDLAIGLIGPTVLGTDGTGADKLIVSQSGAREWADHPNSGGRPRLHMDGPEVFQFAIDRIGPALDTLLTLAATSRDRVDLYLFHQANRFMLTALRQHLDLPADRLPIDVETIGNVATASLPIHVSRQHKAGAIQPGCRSIFAGFGVGFSWALTYVEWL